MQWSPLSLKTRTKKLSQQGVGWKVIWRKWREKMVGRDRTVDSEEPSGLTVGPTLIGRAVHAWMTTKWDQQKWPEGRVGTQPHGTSFLPNHHPSLAFPESSHYPTGNSICFRCSSAPNKKGWLGRKQCQTHTGRTSAKFCKKPYMGMHLIDPVGHYPTPIKPQVTVATIMSLMGQRHIQCNTMKHGNEKY